MSYVFITDSIFCVPSPVCSKFALMCYIICPDVQLYPGPILPQMEDNVVKVSKC